MMSKSVFVIDTPKDCLNCIMRKVLHIRGQYYQMCSLCTDGYCSEAFFKEEELKEGYYKDMQRIQAAMVAA
jgi:hypothetical protein